MPFNFNTPARQGQTNSCGAACAVYVSHWLNDTELPNSVEGQKDEIAAAMKVTGINVNFSSPFGNPPGSTASGIATYLKQQHPNIVIFSPTEVLKNWSTRAWLPALRLALLLNKHVNTSFLSCSMPVGVLGIDYIIISLVYKALPLQYFDSYWQGHFIVHIDDKRFMDPNGTINKKVYEEGDSICFVSKLSQGYFHIGWASAGLDLYIYK